MSEQALPRILIQNGRVIDPSQSLDEVTNVLIEDGHIAAYDVSPNGQDVIRDASHKIVSPGLIDIHVELREPGWEEDETIASGTRAALAGGFTSVACIPNTNPPVDTQASVEFIRHQAALADNCRVFVLACVSKNRQGKELSEIGSLVDAGAVGFSDADSPIYNAELLRRAFEYCRMFNKPILNHPEVLELTHEGTMHEGLVSMVLGLGGLPTEAEDMMTGRDLRMAEATDGRLHIMNVSSAESVELIRRAKSRQLSVSAEVCPHHLFLTDEKLRSFDTNYKVNPPLRDQRSVDACIAGLVDGTLDVIASGHAPRASEKKMQELDRAPFGMIGLETALGIVNQQLIQPGHLDWPAVLAKMTVNPARVLELEQGTLQVGKEADVTVIDPAVRWTVSKSSLLSKSSNTPLLGTELHGRADTVIVGGRVKYSLNETR